MTRSGQPFSTAFFAIPQPISPTPTKPTTGFSDMPLLPVLRWRSKRAAARTSMGRACRGPRRGPMSADRLHVERPRMKPEVLQIAPMLPAVEDVVREIDVANGRIEVELLQGLEFTRAPVRRPRRPSGEEKRLAGESREQTA